jgi:hypothetical protein
VSDLASQRNIARRLEQTQVAERPGGVTGFTTFYASGTFTPSYEGTGTAGVWTYSVRTGFWTRIGNRCFFNLSITAATRPTPPTGGGVIVGLPFTSDATANSHSPVTLDTIDEVSLSGTIVQLTARIPPGTTRIELIEVLGTAPSAAGALLATGLSATATIRISGHYMV